MISELVKLANRLDKLGEHEMATEVDEMLKIAAKTIEQLQADLQEVDARLNDPNTMPERLKELNEARHNIER